MAKNQNSYNKRLRENKKKKKREEKFQKKLERSREKKKRKEGDFTTTDIPGFSPEEQVLETARLQKIQTLLTDLENAKIKL